MTAHQRVYPDPTLAFHPRVGWGRQRFACPPHLLVDLSLRFRKSQSVIKGTEALREIHFCFPQRISYMVKSVRVFSTLNKFMNGIIL